MNAIGFCDSNGMLQQSVALRSRPCGLAFSPDSARLAVPTVDSQVYRIDANTAEIIDNLSCGADPISGVEFLSNTELLIIGESRRATFWSNTSIETRMISLQLEECIRRSCLSPDKTEIACGLANGAIALITVSDLKEAALLKGHQTAIRALCYSHNGKKLASGGPDKVLHVWKLSADEKGLLCL
jgi:WD40 repeat protein